MRPYNIEFVATELRTEWIRREDGFKFSPKGRTRWFQKVAWKFLNWAMAISDYHEPVVTCIRHTIDSELFIDRILKQKRSLFDGYGKEPKKLLIGSEDYSKLMNSPEIKPYHFGFNAELGYGREIVGLRVEVIPWMTGMVVMP